MNKHMKDLHTMKPEALKALQKELREDIETTTKSIKLGNTQNYHAATMKRRQLARVNMMLLQHSQIVVEEVESKPTKKEKK